MVVYFFDDIYLNYNAYTPCVFSSTNMDTNIFEATKR